MCAKPKNMANFTHFLPNMPQKILFLICSVSRRVHEHSAFCVSMGKNCRRIEHISCFREDDCPEQALSSGFSSFFQQEKRNRANYVPFIKVSRVKKEAVEVGRSQIIKKGTASMLRYLRQIQICPKSCGFGSQSCSKNPGIMSQSRCPERCMK